MSAQHLARTYQVTVETRGIGKVAPRDVGNGLTLEPLDVVQRTPPPPKKPVSTSASSSNRVPTTAIIPLLDRSTSQRTPNLNTWSFAHLARLVITEHQAQPPTSYVVLWDVKLKDGTVKPHMPGFQAPQTQVTLAFMGTRRGCLCVRVEALVSLGHGVVLPFNPLPVPRLNNHQRGIWYSKRSLAPPSPAWSSQKALVYATSRLFALSHRSGGVSGGKRGFGECLYCPRHHTKRLRDHIATSGTSSSLPTMTTFNCEAFEDHLKTVHTVDFEVPFGVLDVVQNIYPSITNHCRLDTVDLIPHALEPALEETLSVDSVNAGDDSVGIVPYQAYPVDSQQTGTVLSAVSELTHVLHNGDTHCLNIRFEAQKSKERILAKLSHPKILFLGVGQPLLLDFPYLRSTSHRLYVFVTEVIRKVPVDFRQVVGL
ncbi:hypothetical protein BDN72DRAFT_864308 [Pluteus cervinus]|uniref:Uncharacterized protein n=1 Tax=Pluteus cervinus TaxID=181527 RepID=A0ACD3A4B8_9AGAR|nr:hypothetical protein BDN72DRAFT_864308 [Pluteus cervinus]